MKDRKFFRKMDVFETIMFIVVTIYVLSIIALFAVAILFSVKDFTDTNIYHNVFGWPSKDIGFQFQYYIDIFTNFYIQTTSLGAVKYVYIEELLFNSVLYTFLVTAFSIMTQVVVAYAVSKYEFKLKKYYYSIGVIVMIIPIVGALPSQMRIMTMFHFNDSFLGIAIMKCIYPSMYFLVFYAMFKGLSWTYAEAAQIDGAGHFQIFIRIMLPMISSTILTVFILQAIVNWNDYYAPMLFAPNKPTIAYALYEISNRNGKYADIAFVYKQHWIALSLVTCLPIVILFVIFRNRIMGNVTMGGIKG